jgi:hypothetical protein
VLHHPTPYFALFGTHRSYDHLRVFRCACYPNLDSTTPHKLAPRSTRCVFLGYSPDHKGYRCLDLTSHRVLISRHVVFDELDFPLFLFILHCLFHRARRVPRSRPYVPHCRPPFPVGPFTAPPCAVLRATLSTAQPHAVSASPTSPRSTPPVPPSPTQPCAALVSPPSPRAATASPASPITTPAQPRGASASPASP